jgi:hypothetical protein
MQVTGSLHNIPSNLAEVVAETPHLTVLSDAGLRVIGTYEFTVPHVWTLESLAGFAHSTSILSRPALGSHLEAFERDLRHRLLPLQPDGRFEDAVSFTYDLAVKDAIGRTDSPA